LLFCYLASKLNHKISLFKRQKHPIFDWAFKMLINSISEEKEEKKEEKEELEELRKKKKRN
jgi:hypothetical protein